MAFHVGHRGNSMSKQDSSHCAHSRSTSAGSSSNSKLDDGTLDRASYNGRSVLPDYYYPTPIFVRNTFLDTPGVRPFSLDEFVHERRIHSCPTESLGSPGTESQENPPATHSHFHRAATSDATLFPVAANNIAVVAARAISSFSNWWKPVDSGVLSAQPSSALLYQDVRHEMQNDSVVHGTSQVLCLANALGEPELGSSELPSLGSAGHKWGTCKPCAFLHKRGCENGAQCAFCHLCDEGAKKRQQKEKIARIREMRGMV